MAGWPNWKAGPAHRPVAVGAARLVGRNQRLGRGGPDRAGANATGPLEQRKIWGISCLLRGQTDRWRGLSQSLPTLPLFTNEAAMTATLAARYPAHIPPRWRWTASAAGCCWPISAMTSCTMRPAPPGTATVDAYAAIQRDAVSQVEALLAAGCLDRRFDRLAAAIPTLLDGVQAYNESLTAEQFGGRRPAARLEAGLHRTGRGGDPADPGPRRPPRQRHRHRGRTAALLRLVRRLYRPPVF